MAVVEKAVVEKAAVVVVVEWCKRRCSLDRSMVHRGPRRKCPASSCSMFHPGSTRMRTERGVLRHHTIRRGFGCIACCTLKRARWCPRGRLRWSTSTRRRSHTRLCPRIRFHGSWQRTPRGCGRQKGRKERWHVDRARGGSHTYRPIVGGGGPR